MKARINFRDDKPLFTEIDEKQTPESLAVRMVDGGYLICNDNRWGNRRIIVVNLADVRSIILEPTDKEN